MTIYADYRFYTSEYLGEKLTEEQFERYSTRAALYIENHFIGDMEEAVEADEDLNEKLSYCTCELAEAMFDNDGKVVTSVSNDGYTENYKVNETETVFSGILDLYLPQYADTGEVRFI